MDFKNKNDHLSKIYMCMWSQKKETRREESLTSLVFLIEWITSLPYFSLFLFVFVSREDDHHQLFFCHLP